MIHKPVLLGEVIENLNLKPGMTVVDGTLGAGGHAAAILKEIEPGGKLIGIDWDKRAIENFQKRFVSNGINPTPQALEKGKLKNGKLDAEFENLWYGVKRNLILINDNYANVESILRGLGVKTADAFFVDLGFSSDQIEDAKRGFSFLKKGALDMRYSPETQKKTAADVVNKYSEEELAGIFREYGEEKYARGIAKKIVQERKSGRIGETGRLVEIISRSVPGVQRRGKTHFATRVFQALRIEVNQELSNLKIFIKAAVDNLASGGRLAIISFHSLEDRIVKNFFRQESRDCICPPKFPKCICKHKKRLRIITKKPIVPADQEIRENPRSRSARLRVAEKMQSLLTTK